MTTIPHRIAVIILAGLLPHLAAAVPAPTRPPGGLDPSTTIGPAGGMTLSTIQSTLSSALAPANGVVPSGLAPVGQDNLVPISRLPMAQIEAYLSVPTPQNLPDTAIYQRDTSSGGAFGKGAATINFVVYGNAPLNLLEYRLRDSATGNVLQDWSTVASAVQPGTHVFPLSIPAGLYWYYLDLRPNGLTTAAVLGTTRFAVGEVLAVSGQSLADRLFHQFTDLTVPSSLQIPPTPWYRIYGTWSDPALNGPAAAWQQGADGSISTPSYNSAALPELGRLAVNAFGVPVAIIGYAYGGTAIASWLPGQANNNQLKSILTAAGGRFHSFLWFQGHGDSGVTPSATWTADLDAIVTDLTSTYGTAPFHTIVSTIPDISSTAYGTYGTVQDIRKAGFDYVAAHPTTAISDLPLDLELVDGVHFDQVGAVTEARHLFRAWAQSIGASAVGDQGPSISGISVSGAQITLPVSQAGGTAMVASGDPTTQFQVFDRCSLASPYKINSVSLTDPTKIVLQLNSAPPGAIDVWYRPAVDTAAAVASGVYDNNTADGLSASPLSTGRQLSPLYAGYETTDTGAVPCLLMSSGATFDTAAPKFGAAALASGYGYVPSGVMPSTGSSWTLEAQVKIAKAGSSIGVIAGYAGQPWIGVSPTGVVAFNGADTAALGGTTKLGSIQVADGAWHQIDFSYNAATGTLTDTVDCVADASYVATPSYTSTAIAIGALNASGSFSFPGEIDEPSVFSSVRTSPCAVQSAAYPTGTAGAIAIWPLDGSGRGLK